MHSSYNHSRYIVLLAFHFYWASQLIDINKLLIARHQGKDDIRIEFANLEVFNSIFFLRGPSEIFIRIAHFA